jgi:hypothetical protein
LHVYVQAFFNDGMDGMDTEDPFAGLGGLGSGLGAGFAHGRTPFRSQSFNVGSNSAGARHASPPPPLLSFFFNKPHCNENPIYVFPEKELRGLSPNFNIRVHSGLSRMYDYIM